MTNERRASHWLGELLAMIHGDGGHYRAEHGDAKATLDAIAKYSAMRSQDEPTPDPAETRDMWVSWSDQDGGWIAALGNVADRKEVESRIAAEVQRTGFNRFELRPVRVTLHLNRT